MEVRSHGFTDWVTIDSVADAAVCVATRLYWYVRASELLPKGLQGDRLFVSATTRVDKGPGHYDMRSASLASAMAKVMKAAGVPLDFRPHSARHAGMADGKKRKMTDDEVCVRSNMSRPTYVKYYARQIRRADSNLAQGVSRVAVSAAPAAAGRVL